MKNIKVGDKVWYYEHWSDMARSGVVKELKETTNNLPGKDPVPYAMILDDEGGTCGRLLKDIYSTKQDLLIALKAEEDKKVAEIKEKIKNVDDLIRYMYNTPTGGAEEYTNCFARRAVREKAKELLGIELEK